MNGPVRTIAHALRASLIGAFCLGALPAAALAAPTLDPLYADHAVLQRDRPLIVSGQAETGETVTVTLNGAKASAQADKAGRWQASLPAQSAGGPFVLSAASDRGTASAKDILIGDVWLCSGQSNMEFALAQAYGAGSVISSARDDGLRLVTIPKVAGPLPQRAFGRAIQWTAATPETARNFSAVCYYMVRALREAHKVPIGAINASWGGTQVRAWLDPAGVTSVYGNGEVALLQRFVTDPTGATAAFAPRWEAWWRQESGDQPGAEPWTAPDRMAWKPVPSISYWEGWPGAGLERFDGMIWFRRTVTLTAAQARAGATLAMGIFDELDQTWVNGRAVGNSFGWDFERNYPVPASYLHEGKNEILVALTDTFGSGGMKGPADKLQLRFGDGSAMPIGSDWLYSIAKTKAPPPRAPWDANAGLGLIHNGMIAPMGAFGLKGAAWYQGESDAGVAGYSDRLTALFKGWRTQFGAPDLPVLVVSLPNYGSVWTRPGESDWATLREDQRKAIAADSHGALAITIDVGERGNLHPGDKASVGARLARAAESIAYGSGKPPSGPEIVSAVRKGGKVLLTFKGVTGALHAWNGRTAIGFEICGKVMECRYVDAVAAGSTVTLDDNDSRPAMRVRYAWANAPVVNLYDEAELPVGPFEVPIGQ